MLADCGSDSTWVTNDRSIFNTLTGISRSRDSEE